MKHRKKNKRVVIYIVLLLITIFTIIIASSIFKSESAQVEENINSPKIYFKDEMGKGYEIKEGQEIKNYPIYITKGTVKSFEKDGNKIKFENGIVLEEGKYTIQIIAEEYKVKRTFIVDTTAPIVSGFSTGKSSKEQTIIFNDIEEIKEAILEKKGENGYKIDIINDLYKQKKLSKNKEGKYTYTVNESGNYVLTVQDEAGNGKENPYILNIKLKE